MKRALPLLLVLATTAVAHAHNGFGIAPIYEQPFGIIVTDGTTPIVLKWTAREFHPDQLYRLKVQGPDFPPTPSPPSSMRMGTTLTTFASESLSYEVPLDVSALAPGAWRIYTEYDEPPTCVELEQLPALVVIREDGDTAPFGVIVTDPVVESPIVDDEALLAIRAVAPSAVKVTIEAGDIAKDPDWPIHTFCVEFLWTPTLGTLATDVPLVRDEDAGHADLWKLDWRWDTRTVPDGAYLFRITATTEDGQTQVIWARRFFNVEHPRVIPDTSVEVVEAGAESSAAETAAVTEGAARTDPADGCTGGAASPLALLLAACAQALASSRARKSTTRSNGSNPP